MTLAELIKKATQVGAKFTTAWIPLKLEGKDVDIDFEIEGDNERGYVVNVKIKHDE